MTKKLTLFGLALLAASTSFAPAVKANCGEDCWFLTDDLGKRLGATYERNSVTLEGEIAIYKPEWTLVFVTCHEEERHGNVSNMRRRSRNCSGALAVWPYNLTIKISQLATRSPVVLSGPPRSCGVCVPTPFEDFDLPSGIIPISPEVITPTQPGFTIPPSLITPVPELRPDPLINPGFDYQLRHGYEGLGNFDSRSNGGYNGSGGFNGFGNGGGPGGGMGGSGGF